MSTFYTLQNPRNNPDKILTLMVATTRSKVKSRSHHHVAHLQPPSNVPTTYQRPTLYGFRDIPQTKFYRLRSLGQDQRSTKVTSRCTPIILNQCPYQVSSSYNLWFPRYNPDNILQVKVTTTRSNQGHTMTLHTYTP